MKLLPWDANRGESDELFEIQRAVVGDQVVSIHYVNLPGQSWPSGHRTDDVHEVDVSVQIALLSGMNLVFSWVMDGLNEGLAVELLAQGEDSALATGVTTDVSRADEWSPSIGAGLRAIDTAWHIPNAGTPSMPWAFRVDMTGAPSVVIALGESEDGILQYIPDSLVVIFSKEIAQAYQVPASETPAWGGR